MGGEELPSLGSLPNGLPDLSRFLALGRRHSSPACSISCSPAYMKAGLMPIPDLARHDEMARRHPHRLRALHRRHRRLPPASALVLPLASGILTFLTPLAAA